MTEKKKIEPAAPGVQSSAATPTEEPIQLPSVVREAEAAIMEMIEEHSRPHLRGVYDQRLVAIARTQFELGFLALGKALSRPDAEAAEG
jgi:hypothetical protein